MKVADYAEQKVAQYAPKLADNVFKGFANMSSMDSVFNHTDVGKDLKEFMGKHYFPAVDAGNKQGYAAGLQAGGKLAAPHEIESASRKNARVKAFGANDEMLQGFLGAAKEKHGQNYADILADNLNIIFKDAPQTPFASKKGAPVVSEIGRSRLDSNMIKLGAKAAKADNPSFIPSRTTPYRAPTNWEGAVQGYLNRILPSRAAIPHMANPIYTMLTDGAGIMLRSMGKVMTPSGRQETQAMLSAVNTMSETLGTEYRQLYQFQNGIIKNYLPGSVGEWLSRNAGIPGMTAVRHMGLLQAGAATKMSAEEFASDFVKNGNADAAESLRKMYIDPKKILQQGGKLAPEDIESALTWGLKDRINNASSSDILRRSAISQRSTMYRLATPYHGFANWAGQRVGEELKRSFASKNPVKIAQTIATLGVAFPLVGNIIYELERQAQGKDWGKGTETFEDRELSALGGKGATKAAMTNLELISHLAGFGIATSVGRSTFRAHLAEQFLGAGPSMAVEHAQDLAKLLQTDHSHPDNWKPIARDLIGDVPMMGANLAVKHHLLPTKADLAAGKGKTAKQIIAKAKRDAMKGEGSFENPLNDKTDE